MFCFKEKQADADDDIQKDCAEYDQPQVNVQGLAVLPDISGILSSCQILVLR